MRMCDVGWVWEGQGLDPGVHPSIFGVGEGAEFFGVRRAHFLFHPNSELALRKLAHLDEVRCDISKWRFRDAETNGSICYCDSGPDDVEAEAEALSRLSCDYPNVTGGFYDDMKGLLDRAHSGGEALGRIRQALVRDNPALLLECVVYAHELGEAGFWDAVQPHVDVVSFWVWGYPGLAALETDLERCRERFPGKPVVMGCYLRDYPTATPMPMDALRRQWDVLTRALADGRVAAFDILGTVLIDGHQEQAQWVRDCIRAHS